MNELDPRLNDNGTESQTYYNYVEPLTLPRIDRTALTMCDTSSAVYVEPPCSEKEFLRYAPEFIDDPASTGTFSGLSAATYRSPASFITTTVNAELIGYRTVLGSKTFYTDQSFGNSENQFLSRLAEPDDFPNEDTGLRRVNDKTFRLETRSKPIRLIDTTVVSINSNEPSNYGSFLFRVIPKLFSIREAGLGDFPVLVYANHPTYVQLLELFGVDEKAIIRYSTNSITKVTRVIVPSLRNPNAFLDYESRQLFRQLSRQIGGTVITGRKIYVSRLNHSMEKKTTRVMLNEEQLVERLSKVGVEIIAPESLSAREQVETFSTADMVIGPSGAAMFNTVFCRPGTKVIDIESEAHWIYAHTGLFSSSELRYGLFVGKVDPNDTRPAHRSWTVDVDALLDRVIDFSRS